LNILLEGWFDRNFGDDIMMRIVMNDLSHHNFFADQKREELLIPFMGEKNFYKLKDDTKIDRTLVVIGSGFMAKGKIDTILLFVSLLFSLVDKSKARKAHKATIGCNIGPYYNKIAKQLIKWRLNQSKLITVRDKTSFDFLKKNCKNIKSYYYPDIAFSLPNKWIPDVKSEGCLGVSAYRRLDANNNAYYRKTAEICDHYINATGKKVLLFAFDVENENDIISAFTIRELCEFKENIEIILHTDNGENIIKNLKRCDKIISVRFHMAVMAIRLGIPLVPIIYSKKTDNMLDDLGYDRLRFYIDSFNVEEVISAINDATVFPLDNQICEDSKKHSSTFEREMLL